MTGATTYAIRVSGHLDNHWAHWLGSAELHRDSDGATTLLLNVADQAQLHGVMASLRDLGAELLEVRVVDRPGPSDHRGRSAPLDGRGER